MIVDRIALVAAALLLASPSPAALPEPATPCPAATHVTTIRISRIKPGGSMAGFRKAEADQEAWYAAHKLPDRLFVAPMLSRSSGKPAISDSEAMTFHVHRADRNAPFPPRDAAWTAFATAFKTNSEIASTRYVCLPD